MRPVTQQPPPPGQPPHGGYPPDLYGPPQPYAPPEHPQATTVMLLGILSVAVCGLIAPFAWVMGNRVVREIEASNGQLGGHSQAQVGRIIGIVWTCIMGVVLVLGLVGLAIVLVDVAASST
jgi:uncharacterized membrane protein YjgN (DUF898 family)